MDEKPKGDSLSFLDSIIKTIAAVMVNVITAFVFVGVVLRYGFNIYAPVTSEIPQEMSVIMGFLLIGILWKEKEHITIDFFYDKYGPRFRYYFDIVVNLGALVACCFWLWGSVLLILTDIRDGGMTIELNILWQYYHVFQTLGLTIFLIYLLADLRKIIWSGRGIA